MICIRSVSMSTESFLDKSRVLPLLPDSECFAKAIFGLVESDFAGISPSSKITSKSCEKPNSGIIINIMPVSFSFIFPLINFLNQAVFKTFHMQEKQLIQYGKMY